MSYTNTQPPSLEEKGEPESPSLDQDRSAAPAFATTASVEQIDMSAGVKRIAAIASEIDLKLRIWMFFGGEWPLFGYRHPTSSSTLTTRLGSSLPRCLHLQS